jgi:hypothetical protein
VGCPRLPVNAACLAGQQQAIARNTRLQEGLRRLAAVKPPLTLAGAGGLGSPLTPPVWLVSSKLLPAIPAYKKGLGASRQLNPP